MQKLYCFLLWLVLSSLATPTLAQDSSACEGLSGASFGLCTAAINVGCNDEESRNPGCSKIEENFEQITGETPPWTTTNCLENFDCAAGEFCSKAVGDCNGTGNCEAVPIACPDHYAPVQACDGGTYGNACEAKEAFQSVFCSLVGGPYACDQ